MCDVHFEDGCFGRGDFEGVCFGAGSVGLDFGLAFNTFDPELGSKISFWAPRKDIEGIRMVRV